MTSPFEPPLQLAGTPIVVVRSLDDATVVLRNYVGRRPATRDLILRRHRTGDRRSRKELSLVGGARTAAAPADVNLQRVYEYEKSYRDS